MRGLIKIRERWNEARDLCAAKRRADRYRAAQGGRGPVFQIDCEPLYQSLLGQIKTRFFNTPRFFQRSQIRRAREYDRWVRSRIQEDASGARFVGEGFTIWFPRRETGAAGDVFVSDLREILFENHYSSRFPFSRIADDGAVVLDCGANIGVFTVWLATMLPKASVYAIEPEPLTFQSLCENVERNGLSQRVRTLSHGVCERNGEFELVCRNHSLTQHRLLNTYEPVVREDERRKADRIATVKCVTIDQLVDDLGLDRCDLIKMDIEGAEPAALRGAAATIQRFRPRLTLAAYHQLSDAYALPMLVRELCPDYHVIVAEGHLFAFV